MFQSKIRMKNRWPDILTSFGVNPNALDGKHHPCPACGGKDRFRFDDQNGSGSHFCNQCGAGDGFSLLQKVKGFPNFKATAKAIDEVMGWTFYQPSENINKLSHIWNQSKKVDNSHPYLVAKGVKNYGLKQHEGSLIIPIHFNEELVGLQYVDGFGKKMFSSGSRISGAYFAITSRSRQGEKYVVICEGYATGASIHEATDYNIIVAFNAGNLTKVAKMIKDRFADVTIIIAADNDQKKGRNVGLEAAVKAAQTVDGVIALPDAKKGCNVDWNDLHQELGLDAIREKMKCVESPYNYLENNKKRTQNHNTLQLVPASAIEVKSPNWLWPEYLAGGKLHIFAGQAGTGKTTIALSLASIISSGGRWPDGTIAKKGSVVIWSGEDDHADSLVPRLIASGADTGKIFLVNDIGEGDSKRSFNPSTDMGHLLESIIKIDDLALIILDPIVSVITGDSHRNSEVRKNLQPLVDLASEVGAGVLGITHFTKNSKGGDPLDRVTGSLAFGALARLVFCTVTPSKSDDLSRFIRVKSNIGLDGDGFEYTLERKLIHKNIEGQFVSWGEPLSGTAIELMNEVESGTNNGTSALSEAARWLRETLKNHDSMPMKKIEDISKTQGHSMATLRRAKKSLKIKSTKNNGIWCWSLP